MKPYLVTEDVEYLMRRWAGRTGFTCPGHYFFGEQQGSLLAHLSSLFPEVRLIDFQVLSRKLRKAVKICQGTTVVSLDQVYDDAPHHLESNRLADLETMEVIGEAQRYGYYPLVEQIRALPRDRPITLVDDGCFTGETLLRIASLMRQEGLRINKVVVGLVVGRPNNVLIKTNPEWPLEAIYEFPEAIDWVCERDFFVGVPLSGRTAGLKTDSGVVPCEPEVALPYCLPFGDPIKGASIPAENAVDFSRFILDLSRQLWQEVGRLSGQPVLNRDIPRLPRGVARDDQLFIVTLSQALAALGRDASASTIRE